LKLTAISREKARTIHAEISGNTRADYALRLVRAVLLGSELPNPCAKMNGRKFPWRQKSPAWAARLEPSQAQDAWQVFGKLNNKVAGAYLRTLMLTGMRPEEGSSMTVGMVNLKAGRIDLPKTKNAKSTGYTSRRNWRGCSDRTSRIRSRTTSYFRTATARANLWMQRSRPWAPRFHATTYASSPHASRRSATSRTR
jgi:integrase